MWPLLVFCWGISLLPLIRAATTGSDEIESLLGDFVNIGLDEGGGVSDVEPPVFPSTNFGDAPASPNASDDEGIVDRTDPRVVDLQGTVPHATSLQEPPSFTWEGVRPALAAGDDYEGSRQFKSYNYESNDDDDDESDDDEESDQDYESDDDSEDSGGYKSFPDGTPSDASSSTLDQQESELPDSLADPYLDAWDLIPSVDSSEEASPKATSSPLRTEATKPQESVDDGDWEDDHPEIVTPFTNSDSLHLGVVCGIDGTLGRPETIIESPFQVQITELGRTVILTLDRAAGKLSVSGEDAIVAAFRAQLSEEEEGVFKVLDYEPDEIFHKNGQDYLLRLAQESEGSPKTLQLSKGLTVLVAWQPDPPKMSPAQAINYMNNLIDITNKGELVSPPPSDESLTPNRRRQLYAIPVLRGEERDCRQNLVLAPPLEINGALLTRQTDCCTFELYQKTLIDDDSQLDTAALCHPAQDLAPSEPVLTLTLTPNNDLQLSPGRCAALIVLRGGAMAGAFINNSLSFDMPRSTIHNVRVGDVIIVMPSISQLDGEMLTSLCMHFAVKNPNQARRIIERVLSKYRKEPGKHPHLFVTFVAPKVPHPFASTVLLDESSLLF